VYELHVEDQFSAAHNLRGYRGKCEALHGHNWKVAVSVRSNRLNRLGMVMDFADLKVALGGVIERLDHKYLNEDAKDFAPGALNPTSENIARVIGLALGPEMPRGVTVSRVRVWESDITSAEWTPGRGGKRR